MSSKEPSKNEVQFEPFTFAKNDSNKLSPLSSTNKDNKKITSNEKNDINEKDIGLIYEGKRTNELANLSNKMSYKNEQIENKNLDGENHEGDNSDMMGNYNYDPQEDDFYYFISENIPPQNFSEKLRNIKVKYSKLKEDIEKLKKENKKYNPNFIVKKYNLYE